MTKARCMTAGLAKSVTCSLDLVHSMSAPLPNFEISNPANNLASTSSLARALAMAPGAHCPHCPDPQNAERVPWNAASGTLHLDRRMKCGHRACVGDRFLSRHAVINMTGHFYAHSGQKARGPSARNVRVMIPGKSEFQARSPGQKSRPKVQTRSPGLKPDPPVENASTNKIEKQDSKRRDGTRGDGKREMGKNCNPTAAFLLWHAGTRSPFSSTANAFCQRFLATLLPDPCPFLAHSFRVPFAWRNHAPRTPDPGTCACRRT